RRPGRLTEGGSRPGVTPTVERHPVTADLPGSGGTDETPHWGRWFRSIDAVADKREVVMETPDRKPLMVLRRAGEGRVAQIMSDHIWLWSRGFEGGGPQAEVLRRLAHWLMKEPDLEEETLSASVQGGLLTIRRRTMDDATPPAIATLPSGEEQEIVLEETAPGRFEGSIEATELGL